MSETDFRGMAYPLTAGPCEGQTATVLGPDWLVAGRWEVEATDGTRWGVAAAELEALAGEGG